MDSVFFSIDPAKRGEGLRIPSPALIGRLCRLSRGGVSASSGFGASHRLSETYALTRFRPGPAPNRLDKKCQPFGETTKTPSPTLSQRDYHLRRSSNRNPRMSDWSFSQPYMPSARKMTALVNGS